MCLTVLYRELDLCSAHQTISGQIQHDTVFHNGTENFLMCSVSCSSRLDEWKAVGVHAGVKMAFLPTHHCPWPGYLYLHIVPC